jgi:hypothetical protein
MGSALSLRRASLPLVIGPVVLISALLLLIVFRSLVIPRHWLSIGPWGPVRSGQETENRIRASR